MSTRASQVAALLRTAVFASIFVAFVLVYLPWALGVFRWPVDARLPWQLLGGVLLLAGGLIVLRCVFAFAWTGLGTPAPFDPPRKLVVEGLYRYVRNPMYWGGLLLLVGQWALFGAAGRPAAIFFASMAVLFHLFVLLYEEPTLRREFGADYQDYCRHVRRWWPRLTPWIQPRPGVR